MTKTKVYVGLDIAKDSSKVAILDNEGGSITSPFSIATSKQGIEEIISKLHSYRLDEIIFGMEVSSNYWENMYSYLKEKGISPILLNPYQVKKYRQALGSKIKTDKVDAAAIAELIRGKKYDSLYISDENTLNLRELVRAKHSFERRLKDLKKSVLSLLYVVFPEYTDLVRHPFSKVSMEILSRFPTAVHMAKDASVSKLVKIFRRYQGCNFGIDKAKELIAKAKDSFYSGRAYEARGMTISMQIEEIVSLETKIKTIEDKIKNILTSNGSDGGSTSYEILNTIKGVGIGTIATFIAEVGDISRFSSSDKLISYIGFYPKIFESGKYKRKNPTIQKAGPKNLRYMLYLTSVAAIKHNRELKKYYFDRISAGMPAKKALVKVATKITRMMYSMLKYKTNYDPSRVFFQAISSSLVAA